MLPRGGERRVRCFCLISCSGLTITRIDGAPKEGRPLWHSSDDFDPQVPWDTPAIRHGISLFQYVRYSASRRFVHIAIGPYYSKRYIHVQYCKTTVLLQSHDIPSAYSSLGLFREPSAVTGNLWVYPREDDPVSWSPPLPECSGPSGSRGLFDDDATKYVGSGRSDCGSARVRLVSSLVASNGELLGSLGEGEKRVAMVASTADISTG